jgi:hypothetical protein
MKTSKNTNNAKNKKTEICFPKFSSTSGTYVSVEALKETTFFSSLDASP